MKKRPNIVVLMADQHRADMMACAGDPVAKTPNIDWLAQQGVRFDRTYCQGPLCMPARASLVTERFVRDHGVFENGSEIPKGMPTFLNRLDDAGYHTAEVGKMHLWMHGGRKVGHTANMIPFLRDLGFDDAIETVGKLASYGHDSAYTDYLESRGLLKSYRAFIGAQKHCGTANANEHKGDLAGWSAAPGPLSIEDYVDVWHGRRAVEWIEQYNDDKPFFLWVGFPGPHDPFDAPAEAVHRFAGADIPMPKSVERPRLPDEDGPYRTFLRRMLAYSDSASMDDAAIVAMRRAYYANIALIDDAVGRVIDVLRKRGILDDTWVIYTSDHGEMMGEHRMMAKMVFYEPAVKVPLVVRPPKGTAARVVSEPVQLMDLAATCREIAGADNIADSAASSLVSAILKNEKPASPEAIASENFGFAMFLTERHKLIVYEDDLLPVALFDMQQDPSEDHNLIKDPASRGIVDAMMEGHVRPFLSTAPLRPHPVSRSKRH
jgi:choline-sulfatase